MAAKRTHELIPLCHPLPITKVEVEIEPEHLAGFLVRATVKVTGKTGVEMEALTAVSVACLTIYDMVKAVERGMRIEGIRLLEKQRRQVRPLRGRELTMALMSVADALARARRRRAAAAEDRLPWTSLGRVLTADVAALRTQPPAALSAMDGYAVRAADVARCPRNAYSHRRGRRRTSVPRRGRGGPGRAHFHRRRGAARRRRDCHSGEHKPRRRPRHRPGSRSAGRHIRRAGLDFSGRHSCCGRDVG